jgi:glycosyltransferase involved in cell wall biosynthesis
MKILVVCQYYYPEQFRVNDICEQLVTDGHTVTVLTGLPNYPIGVIPKEYRWGRKRKEVINGVKVIRSYEFSRKKGVLSLGLNYLSYMLSASIKTLFMKKDFDIIFVYQLSPVTMALPAIVMKKITKLPVYLYSCDIWPDSMKNIISNENKFIYKLVKKFSTYLYSQCDGLSVTSKPFIDYFNKVHSIPLDKISYIPQHAEETYLNIEKAHKNGTTDFVFMGNIGIAQDIDCILEAIEKIKLVPNFKVHFVGDGSYLEESKKITKEKGLSDYVEFHGRHKLEEMPKFYKLADACLLTLKADNLVGLTMPSKLQGYMAAGRPVIGAIDGAAKEVIEESKCGVCVNASDSQQFAIAIQDFIENPDRYNDCGENGRKYFKETFIKDIYMEKLETQFNGLIGDANNV